MARYGRGKFTAHKNYIKYMNFIATNPIYSSIPNAVSDDGKINWQVSSGKTTSFYKYYPARLDWWIKKADSLELPGTGKSDDRLSIAARLVHPTKKRVCLICGDERYIGYMYLNHNTAKAFDKICEKKLFHKAMLIDEATSMLVQEIGKEKTRQFILSMFPEKRKDIILFDGANYTDFYLSTQHIKTSKLSPGFMSNCPDRLDGFHDYCIYCRKKNDPGRSDENMRSYNHDRRAFMWWAEGDWMLADTLYNSASDGNCCLCGKHVKKISPDHVGPLSCGFKQIPYFEPLCGRCNSSKNRRFTYENVRSLIQYENTNNENAASWQVRALWNNTKELITNDSEAKELSNYMRGAQDYYLRILFWLYTKGFDLCLSYLLKPEYAFYNVQFHNLNTSTFEFTSYEKTPKQTTGAESVSGRIVRIAFDELLEYNSKPVAKRKINKLLMQYLDEDIKTLQETIKKYKLTSYAIKWSQTIKDSSLSIELKDQKIRELLDDTSYEKERSHYTSLFETLADLFNKRGILLSELFNAEK